MSAIGSTFDSERASLAMRSSSEDTTVGRTVDESGEVDVDDVVDVGEVVDEAVALDGRAVAVALDGD